MQNNCLFGKNQIGIQPLFGKYFTNLGSLSNSFLPLTLLSKLYAPEFLKGILLNIKELLQKLSQYTNF